MAFDGIVLHTLTSELKKQVNSKIDKIYQPNNSEVILQLRQRGAGNNLMISISPQNSGLFTTNKKTDNPLSPPLFCMVLRKHLQGGKIVDFKQLYLDRVLIISIEAHDEMGHTKYVELICEFMGKHSNIILADKSKNTIIDSIKRIPPSISSRRQILPGVTYTAPQKEAKLLLTSFFSEEEFSTRLLELPIDTPLSKCLVNIFEGFSPLLATEVVYRAGLYIHTPMDKCGQIEISKLYQQLLALKSIVEKQQYTPTIALKRKEPKAFSCIALTHLNPSYQVEQFNSTNELLSEVYFLKKRQSKFNSFHHKLSQIVKSELDKSKKKLSIQNEVISNSKTADKYRIMGELITSNIYQIKPGTKKINVTNFYDPEQGEMEIELKPELTPSANAQQYFKTYNKKKKAAHMAAQQKNIIESHFNYLESLKHSLDQAENLTDLSEIELEMREQKLYNPISEKTNVKKKKIEYSPYQFFSSSGLEIKVGKNNKQNDWLTLKASNKEDLWFHTKDIPGAHVVITRQGQEDIDQESVNEAAMFAAYFSKAKYSNQVPVDFTQIKYVHKPSGAKPGMVIYTNQKTIFASPSEDFLKKFNLE
ncbi:putative ribosome quality control (RQC) complex YloA/Tae2 family protein [Desulfitispora alkaliphila]|uniref:Rqc2 family fibronectin-binding protein n=1 Tax=Desulfitispora alkaliphila TaxID=622674 RepID=UPI003D1DC14B